MRMDHFFNDLLSKNKKSTGCALLGISHKRFYVKSIIKKPMKVSLFSSMRFTYFF